MTLKAAFFDLMGTCLDWHSSVVSVFPSDVPAKAAASIAIAWRIQWFAENMHSPNETPTKQPLGKVKSTLHSAFDHVLERPEFEQYKSLFDDAALAAVVEAMRNQRAWKDTAPALHSLKHDLGLEVYLLVNGTTRMQLDNLKSSGLVFDMMFTSELLGSFKPDKRAYELALGQVQLKPEEVVMVAAHEDDVRGAKASGMKAIYVHRWTDDVDVDLEGVKRDVDAFLEGMEGLPEAVKALK